jgi:hypothetical protein
MVWRRPDVRIGGVCLEYALMREPNCGVWKPLVDAERGGHLSMRAACGHFFGDGRLPRRLGRLPLANAGATGSRVEHVV